MHSSALPTWEEEEEEEERGGEEEEEEEDIRFKFVVHRLETFSNCPDWMEQNFVTFLRGGEEGARNSLSLSALIYHISRKRFLFLVINDLQLLLSVVLVGFMFPLLLLLLQTERWPFCVSIAASPLLLLFPCSGRLSNTAQSKHAFSSSSSSSSLWKRRRRLLGLASATQWRGEKIFLHASARTRPD